MSKNYGLYTAAVASFIVASVLSSNVALACGPQGGGSHGGGQSHHDDHQKPTKTKSNTSQGQNQHQEKGHDHHTIQPVKTMPIKNSHDKKDCDKNTPTQPTKPVHEHHDQKPTPSVPATPAPTPAPQPTMPVKASVVPAVAAPSAPAKVTPAASTAPVAAQLPETGTDNLGLVVAGLLALSTYTAGYAVVRMRR